MPRDILTADERTLLALECQCCGGYTEKPLDWLIEASEVDCAECDAPIDVASGDNRVLIDSFASLNRRLDREYPRHRG